MWKKIISIALSLFCCLIISTLPCNGQITPETTVFEGFTLIQKLFVGNYTDDTTWMPVDCPPGFYCPGDGSRRVCRSPTHFCTGNNTLPQPVEVGYYTGYESVSAGNFKNSSLFVDANVAQFVCNPGHYCTDGVQQPCPKGTYGRGAGLGAISDCVVCPEGFYCPKASINPLTCGSVDHYCPLGSGEPVPVHYAQQDMNAVVRTAEEGFYTLSTETALRSTSSWCSTTTPECIFRVFVSPRVQQMAVELTPSLYLDAPTVMGASVTRSKRNICEPGHYCVNGERFECPPGRFGSIPGLATPFCSGECAQGHYCPAGSSSATQRQCGSAEVFCPAGSGAPALVPVGFYSSLGSDGAEVHWDRVGYAPWSPVAPRAPAGVAPAGPVEWYWRTVQRLYERFRDKEDPRLSFSLPDTANWFFLGSLEHARSLAAIRSHVVECERGHFCAAGGEKKPCPGGTYGAQTGLKTFLCSGLCHSGFFCPTGSTSARESPCGGADVYCPVGSSEPQPVSPGHFSVGNGWLQWTHYAHRSDNQVLARNDTRVAQEECPTGHYCLEGILRQCPAGTYGAERGLSSPTCSGQCEAGYFCPPGSTSPQERTCGSIVTLNPTWNSFQEQSSQTPGFDVTCVTRQLPHAGSLLDQFFEFSLLSPLESPLDSTHWDHTHNTPHGVINTMAWDPRELALQSDGKGSHIGTTWRFGSAGKTACMWKKFTTARVFGLDGYYRQHGLNDHFLMGTFYSYTDRLYAAAGHAFPSYATETAAIHGGEWVFYCLVSEGAGGESKAYVATPQQAFVGPEMVWHVPDIGDDIGVLPGTNPLGMVYGSTSTFAVDKNHRHTSQPHSEALYGGILHWSAALSEDELLQTYRVLAKFYPGHGGRRRANQLRCGAYDSTEWPQGFRDRHRGVLGGARQQRDDVTHEYTIQETPGTDGRQHAMGEGSIAWEGSNRMRIPLTRVSLGSGGLSGTRSRHFELEITPAYVFCPKGSGFPIESAGGYYTLASENVTQVSAGRGLHGEPILEDLQPVNQDHQLPCKKGFWCQAGQMHPCKPGRVGLKEKETSPLCAVFCPAGFYCPEGTQIPIACGPGTFSMKGASKCSKCPRREGGFSEQQCFTSKRCCFF